MGIVNMYRDKITVDGRTIRANVYVMSTRDQLIAGRDNFNEVIVVASIPPTQRRRVPDDTEQFLWQGQEYNVQGLVIPIMALGRVDHYEITGAGRRVQ